VHWWLLVHSSPQLQVSWKEERMTWKN
jgi:hypothetical protein